MSVTNGLRPSDWLLARFDRAKPMGKPYQSAGQLGHSPIARPVGFWKKRWASPKVASCRVLPGASFMRRAARRRLTRPTRRTGRKVLYFVDTYANYHDPQLAEALVAVMEHNGVAVYVHPDQQPSGMGLITMGSLARRPSIGRE